MPQDEVKKTESLKNNSRWEAWCDKLLTLPQQRLNEKGVEELLQLTFGDISFKKDPNSEAQKAAIADLSRHTLVQIGASHFKRLGHTMNVWGLTYLSLHCHDSPGELVMLVHGVVRKSRTHQLEGYPKDLTLEHVVKAFPMGFPSREALHHLWEEQKDSHSPNSNYLDGVAA